MSSPLPPTTPSQKPTQKPPLPPCKFTKVQRTPVAGSGHPLSPTAAAAVAATPPPSPATTTAPPSPASSSGASFTPSYASGSSSYPHSPASAASSSGSVPPSPAWTDKDGDSSMDDSQELELTAILGEASLDERKCDDQPKTLWRSSENTSSEATSSSRFSPTGSNKRARSPQRETAAQKFAAINDRVRQKIACSSSSRKVDPLKESNRRQQQDQEIEAELEEELRRVEMLALARRNGLAKHRQWNSYLEHNLGLCAAILTICSKFRSDVADTQGMGDRPTGASTSRGLRRAKQAYERGTRNLQSCLENLINTVARLKSDYLNSGKQGSRYLFAEMDYGVRLAQGDGTDDEGSEDETAARAADDEEERQDPTMGNFIDTHDECADGDTYKQITAELRKRG